MIIKKFMAKDSRSAMTQIRKEFGPDAILLSSKSVGDHFEMVAAPNYDDQDIERELEFQRAEKERLALKQELEKQELTNQAERERELARLHAQDQQTLKVLQDEMADMRRLIEAQLNFDKAAGLVNGPEPQTKNQPQNDNQPKVHIDQYLADIGLSRRLRESLHKRLQGINKIEMASSKTMQILSNAVREMDVGLLPDRGIAAFVGSVGSGKTTALIKLAQKHRKRHGVDGIGLVLFGHKASLKNDRDNVLIKYSTSLGITCHHAETPRQLISAVKSFSSKSLIFIDCAGSEKPTPFLKKSLSALSAMNKRLLTFLTVAADTDRVNQEQSINAYSGMASGLIVSKVKNAHHLGALVELLIRKKMPLGYISETRKMDSNITQGNSEALIRMALSLGKLPLETKNQKHQSSIQIETKNSNRSVSRDTQRTLEPNFFGIAS